MSKMTFTVSLGIAALVLLAQEVENVAISGPYLVLLKRGAPCQEAGTNEVDFIGRVSSKGKGVLSFSSDVKFDIPWDDKLKVDLEVQQLKNGGYTPKFVTHSFKNCEKAYKYGIGTLMSLFAAAGYNFTECPLPAGIYPVRDWKVNLTFPQVSSFIYGSYKMMFTFYKDKKRVGCFLMHVDVLPKPQ